MSNYVVKENTGRAFENDKKQSVTSPDLKGTVNIAGKEYWVNVWQKKTQKGDAYFSFAFNEKQSKQEDSVVSKTESTEKPVNNDMDKNIPF